MMRDSDEGRRAGIHVAPAMELTACCEAQRLGLLVYCPLRRVRIWPKGVTEPLMYAYALLRGCLLASFNIARDRAWHHVQGVRGPKYLLVDAEGRPWTVEDAAVRELCQLERENAFDDPLPGNAVRFTGCDLLAAIAGEALASLFAPLFAASVPRAPTKAELERELLEAGRPTPGTPVPLWVDRPGSARRLRRTSWRAPRTTRSMIAPPLNVQPTPRGRGFVRSPFSRSNGGSPMARGRDRRLSRAG
jgi:hypothetical protein